MSFFDFLNIKEYKNTVSDLTNKNETLEYENTRLANQINNLNDMIIDIKKQNDDLKSFIESRLPLFDVQTLPSFNNFSELFESWNKYWGGINHNGYHQQLRQHRACLGYMTPLNINRKTGTACFMGSEKKYQTSLVSCECMDFCRNLKPCKHIYRIAYELDIALPPEPLVTLPDPQNILCKSQLKTIKNMLSDTSRDILSKLLSCEHVIVRRIDAEQLIRHRIAIIDPNKFELLNTYKKNELLTLLPIGTKGVKSLSKSALIEKIIKLYPESISRIESTIVPLKLSPYASRLIEEIHYL